MKTGSLEIVLMGLGLTRGESKVYLALLSMGESKVGPIIKDSGISRSKVYDILERLKRKGIVSKIELNGIASFQALSPNSLLKIIEKRELELEKKKKVLKESLAELESLHSKREVDIAVFEGFKGFKSLIDKTVSNLNTSDIYEAMGISQTNEAMRSYAKKIYREQKRKKFKARSIFDDRGKEKAKERKNKLHDVRVLPKGWETPALFTVYQDNVGIHIGDDEEIVSISIKNEKIAKSFKATFEAMWKISKPLKRSFEAKKCSKINMVDIK